MHLALALPLLLQYTHCHITQLVCIAIDVWYSVGYAIRDAFIGAFDVCYMHCIYQISWFSNPNQLYARDEFMKSNNTSNKNNSSISYMNANYEYRTNARNIAIAMCLAMLLFATPETGYVSLKNKNDCHFMDAIGFVVL